MGGIAFLTPAAEARAKSEAEGQRRKSLEVGRKIIGGKRKSNYGQLLFFTFQAKFIPLESFGHLWNLWTFGCAKTIPTSHGVSFQS